MPTPTPSSMDALEPRRLFAAVLTAGQTVSTGIRTAGVQKNYLITLTKGQAVVLAAGETSASAFQTELILIAPTGKAIARSSGDAGAFIGKIAPVSGNYVVRVRDVTGTHTGSVNVTAVFTGSTPITDGDDGATIQSGHDFPATLAPGDLDVWTLNATAGQFLSVEDTKVAATAALGAGVLVIGPDGTGVASATNATGINLDVPGVAGGTYYAVAYDPGADASGRYNISFGLTPGVQYSGDPDTQQPLVSGTPRNGEMAVGDIDVFNVPIGRGNATAITLARTGGVLAPEVLLVDPNGKVVASGNGDDTTTITYTAATSGTYSIVTRDRDADGNGQYRLTFTRS